MPSKNEISKFIFTETNFEGLNKSLDELLSLLKANAFYEPIDKEISAIKQKMKKTFKKTSIENEFRKRINVLSENDLKNNKTISETDQRIITNKTNLLVSVLLIFFSIISFSGIFADGLVFLKYDAIADFSAGKGTENEEKKSGKNQYFFHKNLFYRNLKFKTIKLQS